MKVAPGIDCCKARITAGLSGTWLGAIAWAGGLDGCVNALATAVSADAGNCVRLPGGSRWPAAADADTVALFAADALAAAGDGLLAALPAVVALPVAVVSV